MCMCMSQYDLRSVEYPICPIRRFYCHGKYLVDYPNSYTVYIHHARGVLRIVLTIDEWHVWAYKSYDVTTPLTTQTVSPRGSRSPCPDQKGIRVLLTS